MLRKALLKPISLSSLYTRPLRRISFLNDTTGLNEEEAAVYNAALEFTKKNITPFAAEWDRKSHFPKDVFVEAAKLGFASIYCTPDYGGAGMGRLSAALIFEAMASGDVATSAYMSVHNMCTWMIDSFAPKELKDKYMPDLVPMNKFASFCLTEPGSGSDAQGMITNAKLDGDYYVINGSKCFISNGSLSDIYVLMCRTGPKEVSTIVVDKDTKGLSFGKPEKKMGWKSSVTTVVNFEDCRVHKSNLVGNQGFKYAMMGLDGGRINIASTSLGGAAFCLDAATDYVKGRKQFGKALAEFQDVQFKLADMATELIASRTLVRNAARMIDEQIVNTALQMHGGYGYLNDYPIERYFRDLRVNQILEGTNEIMRVVISRRLLKD